ncbi:FAD-dependent oxidoreductase [Brachybacterium sp. FME24]|uniref:FAD-dependent oxidoreductase n=1 Tax=Brachybacterium sp. FME24 TaxID=2742605 RepID=UPI00186964DD|nr:FAD-dependent oxidoreductase [Brachybacterium sp. FME24]
MSPSPARPPILIVGAGPTGMTAALSLARSGIPCRVLEKRSSPGTSSRALGLQARSMEVLAGLGVTAEIERAAYRLRGSSILRGRRTVVTMGWVPPESRFPHTYVLPQAGLEGILRRRLAAEGVRVEHGVEVTGVDTDLDGATVRIVGGEDIRADWVIGADGSRSATRESMAIDLPARDTGEAYYLADAILDLPLPLDDGAMWLGPEGPLMLMRLPGEEQLWRVFIDVSDTERRGVLPALDAEVLSRLLDERATAGIRVRALQWTSVFRTRMGLADSYRTGHVLLAGDAAHVFPPFGGQGMNLGIQDAVNAAWRLASIIHGADEQLLNAYETERRPVAEAVIADVETRRRLYALRNPLARAGRDLLLAVGGRSRRAARAGSLQNSQLAISYRDRTPGGSQGPEPRPGDRAPHAMFGDMSLHELFGPEHATLLLFGDHPEPVPTEGVRLRTLRLGSAEDPDGRSHERYGVRPGERAWVLVRPDGHISARGYGAPVGLTAVAGPASPASR